VEPHEARLVIRFRIDGVLRDRLEPKRNLGPMLVSRIKVMAGLDIAEKRKPHDGRVTVMVAGHEVDVRVSTIPSQYGERVVLRLLDRTTARYDLAGLGMQPTAMTAVQRLLSKPSGMILVTGPTGSGKTTTLYSAITYLDNRSRNIMTIEDPIEYAFDGIAQMQVNPLKGVTFAEGVRVLMRQDPNVILIGEIRDSETASAAVRATTSGHLVLSTLHTMSAVASIIRLIDMGVDRYLLATLLRGLIAQRLVRRLCDACKVPSVLTEAEAARLEHICAPGTPVFRANGCAACLEQGYRGRTAIYEVVEVNRSMEAAIHASCSEAQLTALARAESPSLLADGIARMCEGYTTVEEVLLAVDVETTEARRG
jgi:general secretion pathway protein E